MSIISTSFETTLKMANAVLDGLKTSVAKESETSKGVLLGLKSKVDSAYGQAKESLSSGERHDYEAFSARVTGILFGYSPKDEKKSRKEHAAIVFIPKLGACLNNAEYKLFADPSKPVKEKDLAVVSLDVKQSWMIVRVGKVYEKMLHYTDGAKESQFDKGGFAALQAEVKIKLSSFKRGQFVAPLYLDTVSSPHGTLNKGDFALLKRSGNHSQAGYQIVKIVAIKEKSVIEYEVDGHNYIQNAKRFMTLNVQLDTYLKSHVSNLRASEPFLDTDELDFDWSAATFMGVRSTNALIFAQGLEGYKGSDKYTLMVPELGKHKIIHSAVTNFTDGPLVSLGSGALRELLLLNPKSAVLENSYQTLASKLKKGGILATEETLKIVLDYVRFDLFSLHNDPVKRMSILLEEIGDDKNTLLLKHTDSQGRVTMMPAVALDLFIKKKIGVCRQAALATVYLLDRLTAQGFLSGTVYHIRDNVLDGSHVWAAFIPRLRKGETVEKWHIDPMWGKLIDFAKPANVAYLKGLYGEKPIDNEISKTLLKTF